MNGRPPPSIPGFTLGEKLGQGGQGAVYLARHDLSGRRVALKVLHSGAATLVKRFRQEARVLAALRHPHLLAVCDHGHHDGTSFLAIEYVDGENLQELLDRGGAPPSDWIARVLATVAHTLQFCHESGVIHRDVKPANVLVERATQRPVLVDFGLVKRDAARMHLASLDTGSVLSQLGEVTGTPGYVAPEQVNPSKFGEVSPRTDVYSLGATLYHLLTGEPPFRARAAVVVLRNVTSKAPRDPRELNAAASAALATLCLRCLQKRPAERPSSASELAMLLTHAAGIPPLPDPRSGPVDRSIQNSLADLEAETQAGERSQLIPASCWIPRAGAVFAGFALERELARGGGGAVFVARKGEQVYALKILFGDQLDPTRAERFRREFEAGRLLNHPNVVRLFECGVEDGVAYLCMEYLQDAVPLDRFAFERELPLRERLRLVEQLADALQAAHEAGVVHRDLKPDNVLVLPRGQVKVVDFGLARHLDKERMTLSGQVMGTVRYMAPEQVSGNAARADARTDVYAMGVILYLLIRGELPFDGGTGIEVMAAIMERTPPDPCSGVDDAPRGLGAVVRMAMAKAPEDRYESAAAFGRDLAASHSGSQAVSAHARARSAGRVRWLRRLGVTFAVTLFAAGAITWRARRPRWLTVEQVQDQSSDLVRDAGALLSTPGPFEDAREQVTNLARRLETLRSNTDPELRAGSRLARAEVCVGAACGLAALANGDLKAARQALTELGDASTPAADALRGALDLHDGGDPGAAAQRLTRALERGVSRAEVHRWRAQALVRLELSASEADLVLADVRALRKARGGALAAGERSLKVWALLAKGDLVAAQARLDALVDPPAELRWAVALSRAEPHLAEVPLPQPGELTPPLVAFVDVLEALPKLERRLPAGARLVTLAGEQLAKLSRSPRLAPSQEAHALALLRLRRCVAPEARLPRAVAVELVERCAGALKPVLSRAGIELAALLVAAFPDVAQLQSTVAGKVQIVDSARSKLLLLPALRRAIALEADSEQTRALKGLLQDTLAALGRGVGTEAKRCARESLQVGQALLTLEEEPIRQALILSRAASARRSLGDPRGALRDLDRALALHPEPRFFGQRATVLRLLDTRLEQALADAALHVEDLKDASHAGDASVVNVWTLGQRFGRRDLVRRALETQVRVRPNSPGWRLRLAWWLLGDGESSAAARPHVVEAAAWAAKATSSWDWWVEGDHKKRAQALARAFEADADGAAASLADFVADLEAARLEEGRRADFPPTDP